MSSFKLLSLLSLLAVLFAPSLVHAAEMRLGVAPRINLLKDLPVYSEVMTDFYGTNIYLLCSPALRARAEAQLGQKISASLQVVAAQIPRTSILSITVNGVDDTVAAPFLSALVDQFLKYRLERKKNYYADTIHRVNEALSAAPKEVVPQLTTYRDQVVMASLLDTKDDFEILDF